MTREEKFNDYDGFVEKFKAKKTTDDCYTPPAVYDAVKRWVREHIMPLDGVEVVRPFYPGGDYMAYDYPPGCVVLDNPPFSILAEIRRFYQLLGIRYFLFAPYLTLFGGGDYDNETFVVTGANIIYANGATVRTSFVTDLCPGTRIMLAGSLKESIRKAVDSEVPPPLPVYEYPDAVCSAARLGAAIVPGADFSIPAVECSRVTRLDSQRAKGKAVFGSGFLLSDRAAARIKESRAAAERARAAALPRHVWELSERERAIIEELNKSAI